MATIRKRPNGTWQAAVFVGRDPITGKQLFEYVTCSTQKECKQKARELEQERDEGRLVNIENIRVVEWIKKWMDLKTL